MPASDLVALVSEPKSEGEMSAAPRARDNTGVRRTNATRRPEASLRAHHLQLRKPHPEARGFLELVGFVPKRFVGITIVDCYRHY
jgi:hypothetical protein